jgi:hypothetical protein
MIFAMASVTEAMTVQFMRTPSKSTLNTLKSEVAVHGVYRFTTNSISVVISVLRQNLAKKNMVAA